MKYLLCLIWGLALPCHASADTALRAAFGTQIGAALPGDPVPGGVAVTFTPPDPNPAFSRYLAQVTPISRLVHRIRAESEVTTSCETRFAYLRLAIERDYPGLVATRSLNGQIAVYDEPGTARYIEIGCDDRVSSARFWIEYGDRDLEVLSREEQEVVDSERFPREGL